MTDHNGQPRQIGQRLGHAEHSRVAGGDEGGPQKQILCRIAADCQLRRQHEVGTVGMGLTRGIDDLAGIALHVPNGVVELRDGDSERPLHGRLLSGIHAKIMAPCP